MPKPLVVAASPSTDCLQERLWGSRNNALHLLGESRQDFQRFVSSCFGAVHEQDDDTFGAVKFPIVVLFPQGVDEILDVVAR